MTPWTIRSKEFSRPEYWSGWPFPSPNPGIKPRSSALQADSLPAEPQGKPTVKVYDCKWYYYLQLLCCSKSGIGHLPQSRFEVVNDQHPNWKILYTLGKFTSRENHFKLVCILWSWISYDLNILWSSHEYQCEKWFDRLGARLHQLPVSSAPLPRLCLHCLTWRNNLDFIIPTQSCAPVSRPC